MQATRTTAVFVPCRINVDARWDDACIHEVAARFVTISTATVLGIGSYVDIRRGTLIIIGRVMWVRGDRAGIRTQDPVSAASLVNEPRLAQRPTADDHPDRRGEARRRTPLSVAARAERSRRISSALQFAALTAAASGGAYLLATQLFVTLSIPLAHITHALGG